ncbi:MAG: transposase [Burkholderiales bacterium]|nr:transposase [Burkholderiales bacterium]
MGVKPIVTALHLHYMGLALNRAGTSFEKGALLGSDTLNRNAYEWGLIYIMPLYEALLNKLREQKVLAADETCFNVAQPMGYGKKPEDGKNSPGTCSQTYVLSFGTVFRSMVQLHAYALLEGRGTDAIAKYLDATFKFTALVTDAYGAYGKLLENHPDALHQICLIHCRRYLMTHGSNVQGARDFLDLTPEQQAAVMEKARRENGVFYKEARIYQSISLIYQWEKEIVKARGDPQKLAEIRRKQTALMDLIDKLMDELSEGRVEQSESGRWRASPKTDPLAKACVFYRNNRDKLRCFLKEDNFEIPPDSSVVEQNIRPIALIRNNSHFFTNADYAKVALATFSIFRTLEMNHIDPLEWMEKYCRRLFEHITARGLDRLYLDTGDPEKTWITVRQEPKPGEKASPYCLSSYAADFDFASCIDEIIETGIENRKKLEEAQQQ